MMVHGLRLYVVQAGEKASAKQPGVQGAQPGMQQGVLGAQPGTMQGVQAGVQGAQPGQSGVQGAPPDTQLVSSKGLHHHHKPQHRVADAGRTCKSN